MRLIKSLIRSLARAWLHLWRAVRYWRYLGYSWRLAWIKAERGEL